MNLINISEMAKNLKISTRTIRYYEQIGLIKSERNGKSCRYFNEAAVKRLKQIILLRKMKLSLKDIMDIFKDNDISRLASALITKQDEIGNEINLLTALKDTSIQFVKKLETLQFEQDDFLDSLYETYNKRIEQINSYNEISSNIEEEEQTEYIDVRIQCLPNKRLLVYQPVFFDASPLLNWLKSKGITYTPGQNKMFYIGELLCCEIPKEFINDGPYEEKNFEGGLYAIISSDLNSGNLRMNYLKQWLDESDIFEIDGKENILSRPQLVEVTTNDEIMQHYMELNDHYFPIRYKENRSVYLLKDVEVILNDITLGIVDKVEPELMYIDEGIINTVENNELTIQCHSDYQFVQTPLKYKLPLKIELKAKTDSSNLRIGYGKAQLIFNWEFDYNNLCYNDPVTNIAKIENMNQCNGYIEPNEFSNITWIMHKDFMAILVNDEIRLCKSGFPYQKMLEENPDVIVKDHVRICSAYDSIVTISSLQISEL